MFEPLKAPVSLKTRLRRDHTIKQLGQFVVVDHFAESEQYPDKVQASVREALRQVRFGQRVCATSPRAAGHEIGA